MLQAIQNGPEPALRREASKGLPPVSDTAVVSLEDGRFALLGGGDATGQPTADAWLIDPTGVRVEHHPDVLALPRAGHGAARVGQHILLVGGETGAAPADQAEVLAATSLARVAKVPAVVRLGRPAVIPLGVGSLLVLGGVKPDGSPVEQLEVYERATLVGDK